MKLGLKYIIVGEGTFEFPVINPGDNEWCKPRNFLTELGPTFSAIGIPTSDTDSKLIGFKFIDEGVLVCVSKRIVSRGNATRSNISCWLFIPKNIDIDASVIDWIINEISKVIDIPIANEKEFYDAVPEIFNHDYEERKNPLSTHRMMGLNFASIIINKDFSIGKIISYGYQQVYNNYGLIVCIKPGQESILPNIPHNNLKEIVWVSGKIDWPENILRGGQFDIYCDNMQLTQRLFPKAVDKYNITLKKSGCLPLSGWMKIESDNRGNGKIVLTDQWRGYTWLSKLDLYHAEIKNNTHKDLIHLSEFSSECFYDNLGNKIRKKVKAGDEVYIPYKTEITITISCKGYRPKDWTGLPDNQKIEASLDLISKEINTQFKGTSIYIQMQGTNLDSVYKEGFQVKKGQVSPIPDKENCSGNYKAPNTGQAASEERIEKRSFAWREYWVGVLSLTLLALMFWGGIVLFNKLKTSSSQETDPPVELPSDIGSGNVNGPKEDSASNDDTAAAIEYLDSNETWEKSEMEKYESLKGLFDDLNNMDRKKLSDDWAQRLKGSATFKKIADAAEKNLRYNWNPIVGDHNPTYNAKPDDYIIYITGYIHWLDNNCTKVKPQKPDAALNNAGDRRRNNGNTNNNKENSNNNKTIRPEDLN